MRIWTGLALLIVACGGSTSASHSPDASGTADASTTADAGEGVDAGEAADAGTHADAGTAQDAGSADDAGTTVDAGQMVDAGPALDSGPAIKNVFIILEENQNFDAFKGSSNAPYLNGTLLPQAAYALNYSNPAGIHPSEPNYLWLEAGTNFGITADGTPASDSQTTTQHLVTLLEAAGVTWKSYQEDIDGTTCPLTGVNNYAPKHNPMVYFDDVTGNQDSASQHCIDHVRPFSELEADLQNGTVAQYNFITPNLCDDGHNDCIGSNLFPSGANQVKQTDTWLQTNVPMILNSTVFRKSGALFITWDESEPSLSCLSLSPQCSIGMLVLSPFGKGHGYANTITYDHSSTLRTMEEIFGVQPFLGGAANATDLSDLFTRFP